MDYRKEFENWLNNEYFDQQTHEELRSIQEDEEEIKDRFYQSLEFGTAGIRGKIGAGTNRMNKYTVAKSTQGLAQTIIDEGEEAMRRGVAIAYDVRQFSKEFAEISAEVLAGNGIKAYLFDDIRPTPVLSYTIRKLRTISGIMVTASHNPKEYNGYKAYWEEGSQILDDKANQILGHINELEDFSKIKRMPLSEALEKGMVEYVGKDIDDAYMKDILSLSIHSDTVNKDLNIVYSPLNGCGNILVQRILKELGYRNVHVVKEQEHPDETFATCPFPNPENPEAFELCEKLGKEVGGEILLATDPDADRMAVEVLHDGKYVFINGNQIGALLTNYILEQRIENNSLPKDSVVVKSIVTGDLSTRIAEKHGVEMKETLTGFKNLSGLANEYDITHEKTWIFGYEESIGYNYGTFVRDKDAVNSAMMICEMTAFYKQQGKTLVDVLNGLYEEFGHYNNHLVSIVLEGADGQERIGRIMEEFRKNPIQEIGSAKLVKIIDYKNDDTGMPKSNVLKYYLEDKSWYAVRPSGTEPKIKLYMYTVGKNETESQEKLVLIENIAKEKMLSVK